MNANPLVSIVLPTYNSARTLDRSVTSVLNQTFKDFELIVIDDGSTDDTGAVLGKFTSLDSIRLISSVHRGCAAARNTGIAASKGALIAFQDSDDEWLPTKLEKAVALLRGTGRETGVFYSNMTMIGLDGSITGFISPRVRRGVLVSDDTLDYQVYCIGIQSAVVKRECFGKIGLFDVALSRLIDLDLLISSRMPSNSFIPQNHLSTFTLVMESPPMPRPSLTRGGISSRSIGRGLTRSDIT